MSENIKDTGYYCIHCLAIGVRNGLIRTLSSVWGANNTPCNADVKCGCCGITTEKAMQSAMERHPEMHNFIDKIRIKLKDEK